MVITGEPTIFDEPSDTDSDVEAARKANPPKPAHVQETGPPPPRPPRTTVRSRQAGAPQSDTSASTSSSKLAVTKKVWSEQSIYKVPNFLKALNEKAYKPQMVSLGPYHHDDPELGAMNEHKERALSHFLGRMGKTRDHCRDDMKSIMKDAASCYADLDQDWILEKVKFMDVMILDGVFILEVIHIFHGLSADYSDEDPVFSSHGQLYNFPVIRRDMLLLENQVPFVVLEKLMEFKKKPLPASAQTRSRDVSLGMTIPAKDRENLSKLLLQFCTLRESKTEIQKSLHVVDIYRKGLLRNPSRPITRPKPSTASITATPAATAAAAPNPSQPAPPPPSPRTTSMSVIPSAEFLYEAGVQFRRAPSGSHYLDDVAFDGGGGVLSLPVLAVDDGTESAFLNLVAFERLHVGAGNDVTSYLFFMDNLINSPKDVGLLREERILLSIVGSDEEVAAVFNRLSSELTINPDNSLVHVRDSIGRYCDRKWNRWRANLLHNYFTSPWTIISLVIAVLYLILTVVQTNYAIMDFYKPDDDKKSP